MSHMCTLHSHPPTCETEILNRKRHISFFTKLIAPSERNPKTTAFFRSFCDRKRELLKFLTFNKHHGGIIHPFSKFRLYWDINMFLMIFISLIILPLNIMNHGIVIGGNKYLSVLTILLDLVFLAHIAVNCFTGYVIGRTIEMGHKHILKHYLNTLHFYVDLISALPIELVVTIIYSGKITTKMAAYTELISLSKIVRVRRLVRFGATLYQHLFNSVQIAMVIQTTVMIIVVLHWLTCLNYILPYFITDFLQQEKVSWMIQIYSTDFGVLYFECLFRAISIVVGGVAHDDYNIRTNVEAIFSCICLAVSTVGNGLVLVIMMGIIQNYTSNKLNFTVYMDQVQKYMSGKDLKIDLQTRVLEYVNFVYAGVYINEANVKKLLSERLLEDVAFYRGQKQLQNTFLMKLPKLDMQYVICRMKEEMYTPNDTIIKAGTKGNCMYFIASGTVVVRSPTGREACFFFIYLSPFYTYIRTE